MKRFYDTVGIRQTDGGWQVVLDGRGLKTVKAAQQIVPTRALAEHLAAEWDSQGEKLDPATFPMRDMADYAIDVVTQTNAEIAASTVRYGDTDTLLYRADPDQPLYKRQIEIWEPIVTAFEAREAITLTRISGILHQPQSSAALDHLRSRLEAQTPFALAGMEAMASLAASLIIALEAAQGHGDPSNLWQAASLEEEWQADQWGRDEEAEERREKRMRDFLTAQKFVEAAAT